MENKTRRVAINGLGRIGRMVLRRYFSDEFDRSGIDIVAANDLASTEALSYLFKYDSVHGKFKGDVDFTDKSIFINGKEIAMFSRKDPKDLPWAQLEVDVVLDCTGLFKTHEHLSWHLEAGAKKVILSAPAKDPDLTVVMGVNNHKYDHEIHHVLSNASCTTNSLAPVAKVLLDNFGIQYLFATTVHAYTSSQALIDVPAAKKSRGRSAAVSIIPSSTGAAQATSLVIPELEGKMEAIALRIPIPDGAITEICANVESETSVEEINQAMRAASVSDNMQGILGFTDEDIVSMDIIDDSRSTIVHGLSTRVLGRNMIYMQTWYDNEWGYSCRLLELADFIALKMNVSEKITISLA